MEPVIKEIFDSILEGSQKVTVAKVQQALDAGINPGVILNEGMVKAMAEVGRLFEEGEYFVPEMLIAARAMQMAWRSSSRTWLSQRQVAGQGRGRHGQGRPA